MRVLRLLIVPLPLLLFLPSTTERALAQMAPVPATGRAPIAGRVLTLDECVAIALEAQPTIQATLYDYAAARYRVTQALAPLLPQLSGLVSASQTQVTSPSATTTAPTTPGNPCRGTFSRRWTRASRSRSAARTSRCRPGA